MRLGALAVLLAGLVPVADGWALPERSAACAATVVFRGHTFYGTSLRGTRIAIGARLGVGVQPACRDDPSGPTLGPTRVAVYRVAGIRPAVAVAERSSPGVIYVRRHRCDGYRSVPRFLRCLRHALGVA
jgi:hypothetical protein